VPLLSSMRHARRAVDEEDPYGRGPSGDHPDHPDHSRAQLVEDIVAFIESIDDAVVLFGHSAGGAHALEATANTAAVSALALSPMSCCGSRKQRPAPPWEADDD
jgi:pimeloyl-ACP methyl ester carboxylesterase